MISQRKYDFLRENCIFYLVGILIVLGIKFYYSQADCDSLLWILAPTTHWVELLSGIPFTYISGTGYVNHSLRLLIAPTCSGVRFMVTAIATLVFSFVHSVASLQESAVAKPSRRILRGFGWIGASIVFSWLFTVFVNGLRIITAIYLPIYLDSAGLMGGALTPDRLHTMIGIVVYFVALLTLYRLAGCLLPRLSCTVEQSRKSGLTEQPQNTNSSPNAYREQFWPVFIRKCMPPIFWYFFMTLGLPILSRSYLNGLAEFTEYAVLIACCCTLILLPYCMLSLLRKRN